MKTTSAVFDLTDHNPVEYNMLHLRIKVRWQQEKDGDVDITIYAVDDDFPDYPKAACSWRVDGYSGKDSRNFSSVDLLDFWVKGIQVEVEASTKIQATGKVHRRYRKNYGWAGLLVNNLEF